MKFDHLYKDVKWMGGGYAYWDDIDFVKEKLVQVKILNVEVEWGGKPPKKWGKAVVTYDYNGSPRKQNVMSFSNPDVFKKVQELTGETVEVEVGKNDKDFTEWRSIGVIGSVNGGGSGNVTATTNSAKSVNGYTPRDFETKEERARRQVLIVKQSSLSAAITSLSPGAKAALDPKAVTELAQVFTDWVLDTEPIFPSDEPEDIPF